MTSDVSIVMQPEGTFRYMKNCQMVSQDGNNFVIKDCLGNLVTWTINPPYSGTIATIGLLPMPIGFFSFPDKLIVHSTNDNANGGYGEIGLLKYLPYGEGVEPLLTAGEYNAGYVPLYHHENLNFSQLYRTDGFSYIENELIERIYWTDNYNEPRVFNVSDPIFTTYIASGSIANGTTYMVLEGAITYNGVNRGPGLAAGNIFTGTATTVYTNLTGTSPTPKIIEYYPYQLLDFVPDRALGNIIFDEYGLGSLNCGSKIYFYRLGKSNGILTTWSYGSSPVPVGAINATNALTSPTVAYHDFVGGGTQTELLNSGLSVFVNIENVDTAFDFIELACAEFDQLIDTPRLISIVNRMDITGTTMNIEHSGGVNLGTLTLGQITLFPASILTVKTLATNKNYILGGNLKEREEFDIDFSAINAVSVQYPMNVHYDALSCSLSGMVYSGVSPTTGVNPAAGSVTPFSRWKVISGTAIYNAVNYGVGKVITGITGAGNDSIDTTTNPGTQIRPCVTKNRYTTSGGVRVENSIELKGTNPANTCFWDYKSAAAHHHVTSYWSGETYRYGALFYDLKGNPYYVKWLFDYTFPSVLFKNGITRRDEIGNSGNFVYSLNPSGISIENMIIPPDIADKISGFSIVRAVRDARIVAQGLVTQCVHTGATPDVTRPAAFIPPGDSALFLAPLAYSFICPDVLVDVPLKNTIGMPGDIMEEATWLEAFNYGPYVVRGAGSVAASEQVYSKYLSCVNDGSVRSGVIGFFGTVDEAQSIQLGNGNTFQNGNLETSAGGVAVVGDCVPGGADYSLLSAQATGGKKSFFTLNADFLAYGPSVFGYTALGSVATTEKILMNYVKAGFANPYGGSGDDAKANTLYISTGHFQPMTTQVRTDTFDGTNYVFNNIEVFGGDCFVNLVDYGYALWDNSFVNKYSFAWTFPCENNSNYDLRRGRKTSNVEMYYTGAVGLPNCLLYIGPSGETRLEDYSYNQGYSTEGQQVVYPALPTNFINSGEFQARIRFAGEKFAGEIVDSFRTFPINDYKDLSANYGRINEIKVKEDKVVVWQDSALNTVPILERQVVSGATGDETTIGTGGVIDRFDVITSFFGSQHQWSIAETEYGFAFFDMKRKAFVILDFGGGVLEISQVFGIKAFFDEVFVEIEGEGAKDAAILLNSPTFADTSDKPLTGVGIISVFDPKFKMTYMTFKFYGQNATGTKSKDFTIGYLHTNTKKCMVGFYDWFPAITHNHNGLVISANNPKNTTQYLTSTLTNKSFVVGETLWGTFANKQREYICILNVTLDNVAKFPEGASGSTYWTLINTVSQLMVLNQPTALFQTPAPGYLYNKFDGRVVDNEIHVVVNPKAPNPFSVLYAEQEGNSVNFTDIYTSGDRQSASDLNIKSWNRNYKVIYDKVTHNLPFSDTTGRITDSYLLIRFVKKNWTTNPTVVTTNVKIFRWLKSFFEQKR